MKTVVVFGATGNLGAYISMKLKDDGYNVVAIGGRKNDNGFFVEHGMCYYSVNIKKKNLLLTCLRRLETCMLYVILQVACHLAMSMIREIYWIL